MKKSVIMVVEDEVIVAEDLRLRLSAMGYAVPEVVGSSEEALSRVGVGSPDLILMDIVLEGSSMDGIETAQMIRSRLDVPIIFVTAFADDATFDRARTTDPFAYILKPFNERELHSAIELALHKHRSEIEIKKRDRILFAICFAIEWFLRHQKESRKAKNGHPKTLESGIVEILEHVGLAVNAGTVAVFRMNRETKGTATATIQYLWAAPATPHLLPHLPSDLPLILSSSLCNTILATGSSFAGDTGKLPEEERRFFEKCGIASIAILPLFKDDLLWGFIAISSGSCHAWSDLEMEALNVAGTIVGAVVE
jgi:CheY-like chemotaxis protein